MKTLRTALLSFCLLGGLFGQNLMAQSQSDITNLLPSTQAVMNAVVSNPNLVIVTGRIVDALTNLPITDAKINFSKFGTELVNAAIDKNGNYALALDKTKLGDQIKLLFNVEGYDNFVAKALSKVAPIVDVDLRLTPSSNNTTYKYTLSDDPFNKLVIKF